MAPYFDDGTAQLWLGDCRDVLAEMPDASVDAIVTDPPAGVSFMGRAWDSDRGGRDRWIEWLTVRMEQALRVLKPGGHALVWALPRTSHWTAMALEDAGFDVRDCVVHIFGSGFPKSLDVGKAIDKRRDDRPDIFSVTSWLADRAEAAGVTRADVDQHMGTSDMGGWWLSRLPHRCQVPTWEQWQRLRELIGFGDDMDAEVWRLNGRKGTPGEAWGQREVIGQRTTGIGTGRGSVTVIGDSDNRDLTAPATDAARRWDGWGTALKPGQEIWWLARKPLQGTVAANVLEHGTSALNIDACRVEAGQDYRDKCASVVGLDSNRNGDAYGEWTRVREDSAHVAGRWPTNIVFTHSAACSEDGGCAGDCPVVELDRQSGMSRSSGGSGPLSGRPGGTVYGTFGQRQGTNAGGLGDSGGASRFFPAFRYEAKAPASERPKLADGSAHTTVKPLDLMRWLVRLVTPPGGLVCDPFAGSGTTGEACVVEGFRSLLIEQDPAHAELIKARLTKPIQPTFGEVS